MTVVGGMRTLTLLQGALLVLAILFAAGGTIAIGHPDGYRRMGETVLRACPTGRCGSPPWSASRSAGGWCT